MIYGFVIGRARVMDRTSNYTKYINALLHGQSLLMTQNVFKIQLIIKFQKFSRVFQIDFKMVNSLERDIVIHHTPVENKRYYLVS